MRSFNAIFGLALLSLASPASSQMGWSGWARCDVEIIESGYRSSESHYWFVKDANPRATGEWIVTGSGELNSPAETGQWRIGFGSSGRRSPEFEVRQGYGQVSIHRISNPLALSGGIHGYKKAANSQTILTVSADQTEWSPFPDITGPLAATELRSSSSGVANHPWGYSRSTGSTDTKYKCLWWFKKGSTPPRGPLLTY